MIVFYTYMYTIPRESYVDTVANDKALVWQTICIVPFTTLWLQTRMQSK